MTLQQIGLIVFLFLVVIGGVAAIVDGEKPKRKQNVRLPRETLWARTNRYHGVK